MITAYKERKHHCRSGQPRTIMMKIKQGKIVQRKRLAGEATAKDMADFANSQMSYFERVLEGEVV